jgi:thiosulfate reductase/polysulfide reductase chain A
MEKHGERSVLFSDRGGPFTDLHQAFVRGLGSPNYCNHDVSWDRAGGGLAMKEHFVTVKKAV